MKQVVLFHRQTKIANFTFEAGQMYLLELLGSLPSVWLHYQSQQLINVNCFQNDYIDRHYAQWIDDPRIVEQLLAA